MKVSVSINPENIISALVSAIEQGGCRYWAQGAYYKGRRKTDGPWYGDVSILKGKDTSKLMTWHYDLPEGEEGNGKGCKLITLGDFRKGLELMAEKCPYQFGQLIDEGGDMNTADVMMQYIVLGEVVYG